MKSYPRSGYRGWYGCLKSNVVKVDLQNEQHKKVSTKKEEERTDMKIYFSGTDSTNNFIWKLAEKFVNDSSQN